MRLQHLAAFALSATLATAASAQVVGTAPFAMLSPYQLVTNGLILNLDAANAKSSFVGAYANGCGASALSWYDLSPSGLVATLTGFSSCGTSLGWNGDGGTSVSGAAGPYRLTFNGTGSPMASIGYATAPTLGQGSGLNFSLGIWYYAEGTGTGAQALVGKRTNGSGNSEYIIFTQNGAINWGTGSASDSCAWNSVTEPSRNAWHYVVGTLSSTGAQTGTKAFYIDDTLMFSCSYTQKAPVANNDMRIGFVDNGAAFQGEIGVVQIYNIALTAAQVQQNCNALKGRFSGAVCN